MPVINPKDSGSNTQRTTFRPPWVKDGPSPLPMPTKPWSPRARETIPFSPEEKTKLEKPVLKKQTKITIPIESVNNQNTISNPHQEKIIPIKVIRENEKPQPEDKNRSSLPESQQSASWRKDKVSPHPVSKPPARSTTDRSMMPPTAPKPPPPPVMSANITPPPPPPPMVPLPSPINNSQPSEPFVQKPLTKEKAAKLEALRSRPRRRPDWSDMMKEVESGKKLKHVQCNDRSAPVLPQMKAKGQFVYDSEKKEEHNSHNKLLKQIQGGVRLRKVKCNDRSKPNLDGLRKFRRQMTIEEQLQKSVSMADVVAAAVQPDELDDIDKVRDDLQSAKQMLALELRNKEAMERENKRLLARLTNLEAELEKEKVLRNTEPSQKGQPVRTDEDERLIVQLKQEASEADRIAKDMEQKYHTTAEQLDNTRRKLESAWLRNQELELQLKSVSQGTPMNQLMKQPSKKFIPIANGGSVDLISDDEEDETESESEEESENESIATQERQIARELKLLTTKMKTFREKQSASLKERRILREQLKKKQKELKEEKRKYKILQKEVDKMAKLMKEAEEDEYDDDDDDDENHKEEENEEEEESDSESESEESEEEEKEEEIPQNAGIEEKRRILLERTKRHENRLSSLKKGNNLMKANIERLQDDINKQREMSLTLQEDLNNILADLG
ncbi:hypothetical protein PGB90_004722 [Kerria lacca]